MNAHIVLVCVSRPPSPGILPTPTKDLSPKGGSEAPTAHFYSAPRPQTWIERARQPNDKNLRSVTIPIIFSTGKPKVKVPEQIAYYLIK